MPLLTLPLPQDFDPVVEIDEVQEEFYNLETLQNFNSKLYDDIRNAGHNPQGHMSGYHMVFYYSQRHIQDTLLKCRRKQGHRRSLARQQTDGEFLAMVKDLQRKTSSRPVHLDLIQPNQNGYSRAAASQTSLLRQFGILVTHLSQN